MPKLFSVTYMSDCELDTYLAVGESKEEVEEREAKNLEEELSCFISCTAFEVSEVDGYKIKLVYGLADIDPQNLTSICLKCGIDLGKCICESKDTYFKGYKPNWFLRK